MLFHTRVALFGNYLSAPRWPYLLLAALAWLALRPSAVAAPPPLELTLADYRRLVLERNEALQAQMFDAEANRQRARGEYGTFEPVLTLGASHEENMRQNNVEEQNQLGGLLLFDENNNLYDAGLEALVPSGAKIRLGYNLSELNNNLRPYIIGTNTPARTHQYQTFAGVNLTQPLLKNFGGRATLAGVRLAALESEIAFEEYRRQLMLTVSQAEAAYWNLYFAQEQLRFFDESVRVAQTIYSDSQEKLKAGQASELDVLEAQSGLALRKTKLNDARQSHLDALARVRSLLAARPGESQGDPQATDTPAAAQKPLQRPPSLQAALTANPDFLIQRRKLEQEKVRHGYAKNQLLPELNLKGSYGLSGLGLTPGDALANVEAQNFPSWSVGVEVKVPLAGGYKARHDLRAVELGLQRALHELNSLQTQLANALHTTGRKLINWQTSITDYQTVVRFNEDLLKTQLARHNVGRVEARKVLEVEADLFDAKQSLANALVQYERALLEQQLAEGSLLRHRQLETTRAELRQKTLALWKTRPLNAEGYLPWPNAEN